MRAQLRAALPSTLLSCLVERTQLRSVYHGVVVYFAKIVRELAEYSSSAQLIRIVGLGIPFSLNSALVALYRQIP